MAVARHTSQRITLLMLVLASITILTLDYHGEVSRGITRVRNGTADALAPVQRVVAATLHPFGDAVSAVFHFGEVQTENQRLRTELGNAELQLAASNEALRMERTIETLSSLPFAGNMSTLPAEVIATAPSNFEQTIEIDKGSSSGVGDGMPVVGASGLIGSVIDAARSTSTVLLITDARHAPIGVEDERTGNAFQLQGEGGDKPLSLMPYGSSSGTVSAGADLWTTGQTNGGPDSLYPAGLPVGRVASVQQSGSGAASTGTVTPFVDMDTLEYVSVLLWLPPA